MEWIIVLLALTFALIFYGGYWIGMKKVERKVAHEKANEKQYSELRKKFDTERNTYNRLVNALVKVCNHLKNGPFTVDCYTSSNGIRVIRDDYRGYHHQPVIELVVNSNILAYYFPAKGGKEGWTCVPYSTHSMDEETIQKLIRDMTEFLEEQSKISLKQVA